MLPSLDDLGIVLGGGKLGAAGAGGKTAALVSDVQGRVRVAANKAGKLLGPILGTANVSAFAGGAGASAQAAADKVIRRTFGGFTLGQIGGFAAVALVGIYLAYRALK